MMNSGSLILKAGYLKTCLLLALLLACTDSRADMAGYSAAQVIQVETKRLKIFHYHDYTYRREPELNNIFRHGPNSIFSDSFNTYSFILVVDKATKDTLFRKPCPPLTNIVVAKNEKYITGLSNIKRKNPFQLVIFDATGNLVYKRAVSSFNYELEDNDLREFIGKYPSAFIETVEKGSILLSGNRWKITPPSMLVRNDTFFALYLKKFPLHFGDNLFANKTESVTNYVYWYDSQNPRVTIIEKDGKVDEVKIADNKGVLQTIHIGNTLMSMEYFVKNGYIDGGKLLKIERAPRSVPEDHIEKEPLPYIQLGRLYDYFTGIDTFLAQGRLLFVDADKVCSSSGAIASFTMNILYANTATVSFNIDSDRIPDGIKDKIRKLKNIQTIFFEDISLLCQTSGNSQRRKLNSMYYIIVK